MKKILLLVLGLILITGCGKKTVTLRCELTEEADTNKLFTQYVYKLEQDKPKNINITFEAMYDDVYEEELETLVTYNQEVTDILNTYKGFEQTLTKTKKGFVTSAKIKVSAINKEEIDNNLFAYETVDMNSKELKEYFKEKGYYCK